jgi:hypothetical protein
MENFMIPVGAIPVLDKGYVKRVSSSLDLNSFRKFKQDVYKGIFKESLLHVPQVVLEIKCPLFLTVSLASTNLKLHTAINGTTDFYEPTVDDIKSGNHEKDLEIHEHLVANIQATAINAQLYKEDGSNSFVSSIAAPIASYWVGYLIGSVADYRDFFNSKGAPLQILAYQRVIRDLVVTEYPDLEIHLK